MEELRVDGPTERWSVLIAHLSRLFDSAAFTRDVKEIARPLRHCGDGQIGSLRPPLAPQKDRLPSDTLDRRAFN